MSKERIDVALVKEELADSRSKAKEFIKAGHVFVNNEQVDKPSLKVSLEDDKIEVRGEPIPYVGRGGLKLEKALQEFNILVDGKIAFDIGASTGGFTDCMLQNGAKKVYAIDVGQDQLAKKLLEDDRVISMEKTNVRYMTVDDVDDKAEFVSIDVSFISLTLILPTIVNVSEEKVDIVALIKPQFEAGKERVGKKGIVKDKKVHKQVIEEIHQFCNDIGLYFQGLTYSPIKGGDGNREYLVHLSKEKNEDLNLGKLIENVVQKSHNQL